LPGKHGQHHLIAASACSIKTSNPFENLRFINWHGIRFEIREPHGLGELQAVRTGSKGSAWEGLFRGSSKGEHDRWRIRFSSDFRGR
jgi:hypothetical protein